MAGASPTVRRWELAARLRQLRLDAEVTIEQAAAELMCSPAKISRMETAGRGVQPRDIRDLSRLYGLDDAVRDELTRAAVYARKPGWVQDYRALDDQVRTFIDLESAATRFRGFEALRLPGLLQTEAYSRALIPSLRPPGELDHDWIEQTVQVRGQRQKRIESGELKFHGIVDEAAFRRPVGGDDVMLEQVDRLLVDAARPNVTLQVIPFTRGPHPGMDGSFQLLALPGEVLSDVAFVEGLLGNFLVEDTAVVSHYREVFDDLSSRFALGKDATIDWLKAERADPHTGSTG